MTPWAWFIVGGCGAFLVVTLAGDLLLHWRRLKQAPEQLDELAARRGRSVDWDWPHE